MLYCYNICYTVILYIQHRPPARMIKSPQDNPLPYFSLIGASSFLALSEDIKTTAQQSRALCWG